MIRITQTSQATGVNDFAEWLDDFDNLAYEVLEDVVAENEGAILSELRHDPGPVVYPIQWASERQRRAFFASDGFGRGIPTQRTGAVQAGWKLKVDKTAKGFAFTIENDVPYAKYVYGSLAQNAGNAARFQQPFHRNTGWQAASPTAQFWLEAVQEEYVKELKQLATVASKRRAYTKGRR